MLVRGHAESLLRWMAEPACSPGDILEELQRMLEIMSLDLSPELVEEEKASS